MVSGIGLPRGTNYYSRQNTINRNQNHQRQRKQKSVEAWEKETVRNQKRSKFPASSSRRIEIVKSIKYTKFFTVQTKSDIFIGGFFVFIIWLFSLVEPNRMPLGRDEPINQSNYQNRIRCHQNLNQIIVSIVVKPGFLCFKRKPTKKIV